LTGVTRPPTVVFLTGASGLLGGALARRLVREPGKLCVLLHARRPPWTARRSDKVRAVSGDIRRARLGLAEGLYRELADRVTEIVHCAARTEFSMPRPEAHRANVMGTRNLIAFAEACRNLQKVGVLSTAYVAGRRRGVIREGDLEHRAGFVNAYEESKCRMERFLRRRRDRLPIAVYRLGTVIGSAETGRVEQLNAVHHALRLYHRGLVPMVPGEAGSPVDLISSEYAADALFHLYARTFQAGTTYHIVAGKDNTMPLGQFLDWTAELFARFDPRWRARAVARPPLVPVETFRRLEASIAQTGNSLLRQIVRVMGAFAPQLGFPKQFDDRNTRRGLRGSGIRPAPLATFYPRIVRRCLDAGWGAPR
jgi:nucleoside-diphosphate-sugar epimerase